MLTREIQFSPGYAKWSEIPSQNYGFGSVHIHFVLKGPKGALVFTLFTDFYPQAAWKHWKSRGITHRHHSDYLATIDYHAVEPQWEDQTPNTCQYTPTGSCYCGGTSPTDELIEAFILEGDGPIWAELEERYAHLKGPTA